MARQTSIALLIALAAVVLNIAVAWGAVWLRYHGVGVQQMQTLERPPGMPDPDVRQYWEEEFGPSAFVEVAQSTDPKASVTYSAAGMNLYQLSVFRYDAWGCENISVSDQSRQAPTSMEVLQAGWPMKTLRCERVFAPRKYGVKHAWMAFANNGTRAGGLVLPLKPMWMGAIVNTMLYAAILLAMWMGLARVRRSLRIRRRRCTSCGYDLRAATSDVCPECGTPRAIDADRAV